MSKTKTMALGLLLVGAALGVTLAAPVASASHCIAYVNVPHYGRVCVPPGFDGPCIGYVHDPIHDEWYCIPHP